MDQEAVNADGVGLSESAARRIAEVTTAEGRPFLRVSVVGGGCSGFSYVFDFADAAGDDDIVIARDEAQVLIDETSLPFLTGSIIDYVDELIGASFQIRNPNATASCGCGTSFAV